MSAAACKRRRKKAAAAAPQKAEPHRESAAAWSERMQQTCEEINRMQIKLTPRADGDLKAAMLATMKAMRLHLDRLGREKRVIAICAAGSICPEGMEGCEFSAARPITQCANCWENFAAKKIGGG